MVSEKKNLKRERMVFGPFDPKLIKDYLIEETGVERIGSLDDEALEVIYNYLRESVRISYSSIGDTEQLNRLSRKYGGPDFIFPELN